MTATLFPGVEFLFSITQVIDFKQGRTGYIETHKFIKSISCSSIQNQRINKMTLKNKELLIVPCYQDDYHPDEGKQVPYVADSNLRQIELEHQCH